MQKRLELREKWRQSWSELQIFWSRAFCLKLLRVWLKNWDLPKKRSDRLLYYMHFWYIYTNGSSLNLSKCKYYHLYVFRFGPVIYQKECRRYFSTWQQPKSLRRSLWRWPSLSCSWRLFVNARLISCLAFMGQWCGFSDPTDPWWNLLRSWRCEGFKGEKKDMFWHHLNIQMSIFSNYFSFYKLNHFLFLLLLLFIVFVVVIHYNTGFSVSGVYIYI